MAQVTQNWTFIPITFSWTNFVKPYCYYRVPTTGST